MKLSAVTSIANNAIAARFWMALAIIAAAFGWLAIWLGTNQYANALETLPDVKALQLQQRTSSRPLCFHVIECHRAPGTLTEPGFDPFGMSFRQRQQLAEYGHHQRHADQRHGKGIPHPPACKAQASAHGRWHQGKSA